MPKPPIRTVPDLEKEYGELSKGMIAALANAANACMDWVAINITQKHMIPTRGISAAIAGSINPTKLTWRTGRLAGSWLKNYRFTKARLPRAPKVRAVTGKTGLAKSAPLPSAGGIEGERKLEYLKGCGYRATMISEVEYAAVHEFGGKHHPKRPSAEPGLETASKKFPDIIDKEIARTLKAYGW